MLQQGGRFSSPIAVMRMLGVSCFLLLVGVVMRRLVVCHADAVRSDPSTVWQSTLLGEPMGSGGVQGPGQADNFRAGSTLGQSEVAFYILDSVMMALNVLGFLVVWPPSCLEKRPEIMASHMVSLERR